MLTSRHSSLSGHNIYGRRLGRPLKPHQQARLKRLFDTVAIVLSSDATTDPLEWFIQGDETTTEISHSPLAPSQETTHTAIRTKTGSLTHTVEKWPNKLWLEMGFGAGEHLAWQAAHHPHVGMIGAEYFLNGVSKTLSYVENGLDGTSPPLENIRLFFGDTRDLLSVLPTSCLNRAFLLFPDPWPKRRHHRRRLLNEELLAHLTQVLETGAELRIATDHRDYLTWILRHMQAAPQFEWQAQNSADWQQRPADWPMTRYEEKAVEAGRPSTYLRYILQK